VGVVYSTQFLAEAGANPHGTYVVPVGFVAIVRDIDVWFDSSLVGQTVTAFVNGVGFWVVALGATALPGVEQWRGRQVCNEPGAIDVDMSGDGSFVCSGYLLSLP
jgi:hypothetical protein